MPRGCRLADTWPVTQWVAHRWRADIMPSEPVAARGRSHTGWGRRGTAGLGLAVPKPGVRPTGGRAGRRVSFSEGRHVARRIDPTSTPSRRTCLADSMCGPRTGRRPARRPACPGAVRAAGPHPSAAHPRGDRRRPVARSRRDVGRVAPPGALARSPRPDDAGVDPDAVLDIRVRSRVDPPEARLEIDIVAFEEASRTATAAPSPRSSSTAATSSRPWPRLLRRRARAAGRPLRGRPRGRRACPAAHRRRRGARRAAERCSRATRSARRPTRS